MELEMVIDYPADSGLNHGLNRCLHPLHAAGDQLLQVPAPPDLSAATQINRSAQRITSQ
jgi:hypothetical protein